MTTYKVIKRKYSKNGKIAEGYFIAQGQWADGHLAYSRCNINGKVLSETEAGSYIQIRSTAGLIMIRI